MAELKRICFDHRHQLMIARTQPKNEPRSFIHTVRIQASREGWCCFLLNVYRIEKFVLKL